MKKIFAALLLIFAVTLTSPAQAQSNFNFDENNFQMLTTGRVPEAVVVNIKTYLSVRANPSVYSRELDRIPNGTRLGILDNGSVDNGFYNVFYWGNNNNYFGYVHSSYVRFTGGHFELP